MERDFSDKAKTLRVEFAAFRCYALSLAVVHLQLFVLLVFFIFLYLLLLPVMLSIFPCLFFIF